MEISIEYGLLPPWLFCWNSLWEKITLKWNSFRLCVKPILFFLQVIYFFFNLLYAYLSSLTLPIECHWKCQMSLLFSFLLILLPSDLYVSLLRYSTKKNTTCEIPQKLHTHTQTYIYIYIYTHTLIHIYECRYRKSRLYIWIYIYRMLEFYIIWDVLSVLEKLI